jgi:hypothetical protein
MVYPEYSGNLSIYMPGLLLPSGRRISEHTAFLVNLTCVKIPVGNATLRARSEVTSFELNFRVIRSEHEQGGFCHIPG